MIDFLVNNDIKSGMLYIKDNSSGLTGITEGYLIVSKLGFKQKFTSSTSPTLNGFLNPSLNINMGIQAKTDDVVEVEYLLLSPILNSTFSNNGNIVAKVGISTETANVKYLYSDGALYEIDKLASQANQLFLKSPFIGASTSLYKAQYVKKCVGVLYDIPKLIKTLTLSQADCACKTCGDVIHKIDRAHSYITALNMSDESDCGSKIAFMKCLKDIFNIC